MPQLEDEHKRRQIQMEVCIFDCALGVLKVKMSNKKCTDYSTKS